MRRFFTRLRSSGGKLFDQGSVLMSNRLLPILVGISVVAATLFLWQALIAEEQAQIEQKLHLQATNAKIQTQEVLEDLTFGLVRMAKRWEYGGQPSQSAWKADAALYIQHYPTYQAIEWVDPSGYVRWMMPLEGNEVALNQKLTFEPQRRIAFEAARQQRQVVLTPTIELKQFGKGFLVYVPIFHQDKFDGVILGVFRSQKLFDTIFNELDERVGHKYAFAIFEDNKEIYSHYRDFRNKFDSKKWEQETTINFYSINWRLKVWPEPEFFDKEQFPLKKLILGGGLVLAVLLSLTISLVQSQQRHTKRLDVANQNLKREITERQRVESALQENQELWQLVVRGSNDGIWDWNVLTNEVFFSSRWKQMRGFQEHEIGNSLDEWSKSIHPDHIERVMQAVEDYFAKKTPFFAAEYRVRRSDDSYMWILDRGQALWNEAGNVVRMAGSETDITERKMAEEARRESEERFRVLVTVAPVGIFQTDCQGNCLFVNPRWMEMTGLSMEQAQGTGWSSALHPDDSEQVFAQWYGASQTGREFAMEYRFLTPQGKVIWVRGTAVAIRDESGGITGYLGTVTDITQLQLAQEKLLLSEKRYKDAKEAAEAANRAKSTFLASMSHELRTPLNAILGFSQILTHEESLAEQQRKHIGIINRSGEHLLGLINDVLSMSKIEAGRITLDENSFDLYDLLNSIEEMLLLKANTKGLQLKFECEKDVPQYVKTDANKLRQVLINLLGNAIKFTQQGSVTLRVSVVSGQWLVVIGFKQVTTDNEQLTIQFEVSDTGLGIDSSELNTLFDPFVQTKTGRQSIEGTGLGLPISRQFIQLMGGDITVNSIPGQWSIFTFDIKVNLASSVDVETQVSGQRVIGLEPNQPKYRILVVEDIEENRLLLFNLLEPLGFEVREAVNGKEAVAMYSSWQPHLIMMDIRMPVMDGYQATKQIRKVEGRMLEQSCSSLSQQKNPEHQTNSLLDISSLTLPTSPVIIALTASAFEEQREVILSIGCDDFIRKPFRQEKLYEKIAQHLGVRYLYQSENQSPSTQESAQPLALTKDALGAMPSEWVQELYQAALAMDEEIIIELIKQIPENQATLAQTLTNLIDQFRLDLIVDVVLEIE